jgi:DNA polymerase-4
MRPRATSGQICRCSVDHDTNDDNVHRPKLSISIPIPMPIPISMSPMPRRWIMHVDMDAFYAAIEQRDNPALRGRPVVVGALPGGRGVVATCSYEARCFGIRSAMPINEAHRRCPDAIYLRPRMAHYVGVSRRIREVLSGISPRVEQVSIDEAYVDLAGLEGAIGPPSAIGGRIKALVGEAVGLTVSVGIGPNRLIAKLASDYHKPDGLTVVAPEQVQAFLDPQPVSVLRGVGPRTLPRLQRLGIRTVADLRRQPPVAVQLAVGAQQARHLLAQSRGLASSEVHPHRARKSISKETTFARDQTSPTLLQETLRGLAAEVAATARRHQVAGRVVTLKVRYQGFETHGRRRRLSQPTAREQVLLDEAWSLFQHGRLPRLPVRLIGVGLAELGPPMPEQPDLFDTDAARERERRLAAAVAAVNTRFGSGALRLGLSEPLALGDDEDQK